MTRACNTIATSRRRSARRRSAGGPGSPPGSCAGRRAEAELAVLDAPGRPLADAEVVASAGAADQRRRGFRVALSAGRPGIYRGDVRAAADRRLERPPHHPARGRPVRARAAADAALRMATVGLPRRDRPRRPADGGASAGRGAVRAARGRRRRQRAPPAWSRASHCGACVRKIERMLEREGGLETARVNLTTRRLTIRWHGEPGAGQSARQGGGRAGLRRRAVRPRSAQGAGRRSPSASCCAAWPWRASPPATSCCWPSRCGPATSTPWATPPGPSCTGSRR